MRLTRAYTGFFTLIFSSEAEMATRHGAAYPDQLGSLLATHIVVAREAGEAAGGQDSAVRHE